ncbi:MAG: DUF4783 domain-containing protein [Bacteroidota bacterium]
MNLITSALISIVIALSAVLNIPFDEVQLAFEKGEASEVMELGKSKVLITIEEDEGVYSTSQGTQVLKKFFKQYPPSSFTFDFKGKDEGASSFGIGNYHSGSDRFRVSIKFEKKGSRHVIESIEIAKSK